MSREYVVPIVKELSTSFRYFRTSPEVVRLAVMMYVRFPLSLRKVEDLLQERGVVVHSSLYNHFNQEHHLYKRPAFKQRRSAALAEWRPLCAA